MTSGVALDPVLQGSRLASGPLELALLSAVIVLWLLFGAWLWRASERVHGRGLALVYGFVAVALCAGVLAQEALLFYTGVAVAGYASVAMLLAVHGVDHARTAAAQTMLLVLGDLILFELLAYLYSEAQATGFGELRAAYREKGGGLSFVGGLLVATGGCRIAGLFLLAPLPGRLTPWRPGAFSGLLCIAMVAGLLLGVRLVDPSLAAPGVWYTLLAMLGAALVALSTGGQLCIVAGPPGRRNAGRVQPGVVRSRFRGRSACPGRRAGGSHGPPASGAGAPSALLAGRGGHGDSICPAARPRRRFMTDEAWVRLAFQSISA